MSQLIQIKRSLNTATPSSLANGEFAYTANGDVLYIGSNGGIIAIGGKRVPGTLTANQAMVTNATSYMDVIKTANLYIGSTTVNTINTVANSTALGAAGNNELTSTWAIKTYVDSKVAASSGLLAGDGLASNSTHYSVLANSGIIANSTGAFVQAGTGVTVNSTGVHIGQNVATSASVSFQDITVSGNLIINGTLENMNATNLVVTDPLITLANGNATTDSLDIGFYGIYGNSTVTQYTGLYRDASNSSIWTLFNTQALPTTTVDTANNTYSLATLLAGLKSYALISNATNLNITANSTLAVALVANTLSLTTALPVTSGGTGAATFTTNGVLFGNGTSAIQVTSAGTDGKVLTSVSGTPSFTDLDGGSF